MEGCSMKTAIGDVPRIRARHAFAVVSALSICAAIAACKDNSSAPTTPDTVTAQGPDTLVGVVATALGTEVEVRVLDVNLRPVPNASVAFAVSPASGATLTPATEPTDDSGFARATVTLGTVAGMDTVTATIADATPATVFLMVNGGAPSKVMADSGSQQTAAAGAPLPDSLVALVTDQYGNPLANVTVTWSTASSGTLGVTTTQTDANGLTANTYILASTAGTQTVLAQVSASVHATFTEVGQ
jgi:hypothetical protein